MPTVNRVVTRSIFSKVVKGLLGRFTSGRFGTNYLLQSENLGTTWINSGSSNSLNATTAPSNALTADKLIESAGGTFHLVRQDITIVAGSIMVGAICLAPAERTFARFQISNSLEGVGAFVDVNLSTGALGTATAFGGATSVNATVTKENNGFWRVVLSTTIGLSATTLRFQILTASALGTVNYAGDGTSGIYVWGGHVNYGTRIDTYLPTTTTPVTQEEAA